MATAVVASPRYVRSAESFFKKRQRIDHIMALKLQREEATHRNAHAPLVSILECDFLLSNIMLFLSTTELPYLAGTCHHLRRTLRYVKFFLAASAVFGATDARQFRVPAPHLLIGLDTVGFPWFTKARGHTRLHPPALSESGRNVDALLHSFVRI